MKIKDLKEVIEEVEKVNMPRVLRINTFTYKSMVRAYCKEFGEDIRYTSLAGIKLIIDEDIPNGLALIEYSNYSKKLIKVFR